MRTRRNIQRNGNLYGGACGFRKGYKPNGIYLGGVRFASKKRLFFWTGAVYAKRLFLGLLEEFKYATDFCFKHGCLLESISADIATSAHGGNYLELRGNGADSNFCAEVA